MSGAEFQRVSTEDLKRMCLSAGLPFPEDEIDRLILTCPKDEDEKVAFEDFIVHLEKSQMELINGVATANDVDPFEQYNQSGKSPTQDADEVNQAPAAADQADEWQQALTEPESEMERILRENEKLKNEIRSMMKGNQASVPVSQSSEEEPPMRVGREVNSVLPSIKQKRAISNVFPEVDTATGDMFGQANHIPKVAGRRKFKVVDPPTEDIFGNKINHNTGNTARAQPPPAEPDLDRPKVEIESTLLDNIRACMDRNNKRALDDVTHTVGRWNGGKTMTRRMLMKIVNHAGLRMPNETLRILFEKLDVRNDGTVDLGDFFQVFKDAETSVRIVDEGPGQISRERRAEMARRAAPWATF